VDEIVVFKSLTGLQLRSIVDLMVADLRNRLIAQGMSIELTDAARDLVAREGTDPVYGARPLRRAIQTLIEDPLAEELLAGKWHAGDVILVDAVDDQLTFARGEGEIPTPTERVHMELPRARSHWGADSHGGGRPAQTGDRDLAASGD
jgi:ATP-dependent Clp protease ATP-binding subunit ClpC